MTRTGCRDRATFRCGAASVAPAISVGRRIGLVITVFLLLAEMAIGQEAAAISGYKVEAAFLRNFTRYVSWPEQAFPDAASPWRICVLGNDPFGKILEATLLGRTEQGRPFEVYRAATLDGLPPCQIVFVAYADPARRRAVLARLRGQPVLTVGEAAGFLQEGGIIRLQQRETVQMSVDLDRARTAALTIQTRMLEVSAEVVENGVVRKTR